MAYKAIQLPHTPAFTHSMPAGHSSLTKQEPFGRSVGIDSGSKNAGGGAAAGATGCDMSPP